MQYRVRPPMLLLLFTSLYLGLVNFGCGGGGKLPASSQINQSQQDTSQSMQFPMLGFVSTSQGSEVRAILGIPGASTLSQPLTMPSGVTNLHFAPGQNYAIALGAAGAPLGVVTFSSASPGPAIGIPSAISQPDIIAFSPNGASAAIYSASGGQIQVINGLPTSPRIAYEMGSTDLAAGARLLALADDGATLLEGTSGNAVYRLVVGTAPQLLDTVGDLEGIAFVPQSENALVFDRNAGSLSMLQAVNTLPSNRSLVDGLTGLGGEISLQVAGGTALLTSSTANRLWRIDLQSLNVQSMQLPTPATALAPLRTSGRYLVSWQSGQPAWIVDTTGPTGALFFVPANVDAGAHP